MRHYQSNRSRRWNPKKVRTESPLCPKRRTSSLSFSPQHVDVLAGLWIHTGLRFCLVYTPQHGGGSWGVQYSAVCVICVGRWSWNILHLVQLWLIKGIRHLQAGGGSWGQTYDCLWCQCPPPSTTTQPSSQRGNVFLEKLESDFRRKGINS